MKDKNVIKFNDYLKTIDNSITKSNLYSLKNLLTIVSKGTLSYYNLAHTFNFLNVEQITESFCNSYIIKENDNWYKISYNLFGTVEAWWIICKLNNVTNPFQKIESGTKIIVPNSELINLILKEISQNA